jgi:hypothetical protein
MKLVALFDLFGLPDCAAELLVARPELTVVEDRNQLLNLLVKSAGFDRPYEQPVKCFEESVDSFLSEFICQAASAASRAIRRAVTPDQARRGSGRGAAKTAEAHLGTLRAENDQKQRLLSYDRFYNYFFWKFAMKTSVMTR